MAVSNDGEASLATIVRALWRNKRSIIGPSLIVAAAAFIAVNLMPPKYKSEARVLFEGRENIFLRPEADKTMIDRGTLDQEALASQVQLVLSRDLAREVIARLDLAEIPEFNSLPVGFSVMTIPRILGLARDPQSMLLEERLLAAYYERLNAYAVDKSRVIVIEFLSSDPELTARAANTVAERYLVLQQVAKQDQARSAGQWLSGELEKLRSKVAEAEAKVEEFRAKSNIFMGANNTSLSGQQLSEINTQISAARAQKADAKTRARAHPRPVAFGSIVGIGGCDEFRVDPPPLRAAGHSARATRRAVLDAVAAASAHQGASRADRRSRSADPYRG